MAVFTAYFDESGKTDDHDVVTVSGLVSSAKQWDRLEGEWRQTLRDFKIDVAFHMTDFEARKKAPWSTLGPDERVELMRRLTGIMVRRVKARFYSAVLPAELHTLVKRQGVRKVSYGLCALGCASRISEWSYRYGDSIPVHYVFEEGGQGQGVAFNAFDEIVRLKAPDPVVNLVIERIGSRTRGDKRNPPLQAADIWAYETRKFLECQYRRQKSPIRQSLRRLLDIPDGKGFVIGGTVLMQMATAFQNGSNVLHNVAPVPFAHHNLPDFSWPNTDDHQGQ